MRVKNDHILGKPIAKKTVAIVIVLVVILVFASLLSGAVAAQETTDTTHFDGYTYTEAGEPIEGATVTVMIITNDSQPTSVQATSDSSGYFNVTDVETGALFYLIKMEKWEGETITHSSESQFSPLPADHFANLETNTYYLSEAAQVNVEILPYDVRTGEYEVQFDKNHSVTGYGESLEWMADSNQWAYIDAENNLQILNSDFSHASSVSIPVENATGLYYSGNHEFYTLTTDQHSLETSVEVFTTAGEVVRNYTITDTESSRYYRVSDIAYHDGSFYIMGDSGSKAIDRYDESFTHIETVSEQDHQLGQLARFDGYWYLLEHGEVKQLDDNWNLVTETVDEEAVQHDWQSPEPGSGLATDGENLYLGVKNTESIGQITLPAKVRDGYAQGYEISDVATGLGMGGGHDDNVVYQNFSFAAPIDREYSIKIDRELSSAALNYHINDISSQPDYDAQTNSLDLQIDLSTDRRQISGTVSADGSSEFDDLTVVYYKMRGDRLDWTANENRTGEDQYRPAEGQYNITITTPSAYDEEYVLFATAYDAAEDQHYGAVTNVTLEAGGGDISGQDMVLEPLAGEEALLRPKPFGPPPEESDSKFAEVTTATKTFELVDKSTGDPATLSDQIGFLGEVRVDYTEYWADSTPVTWTPMGGTEHFQWSGSEFTIPVFGREAEAVWIMAPGYAPRKQTLTQEDLQSDGPVQIELGQYNPGAIDDSASNLSISVYRGQEAAQPDPSGLIKSTNQSDFNPLEVALLGGHLGLRVTDEDRNITVHYDNINPTRSGPPDALFDTTPKQTETDGTWEELWRFGSTGPEKYDSVLISMPYNASLDNGTIEVEITHLYDEDFNEVWNASTDDVSDIESDPDLKPYRDYLDTDYEAYLDGTGVVADENDPTLSDGIAYKDVENNQLWLEIPHFTGVGVAVGKSTGDIPPIVGDNSPQDPDDDGKYEDINGNGDFDIGDVQALFANRESDAVQNNVGMFDFNDNNAIDIGDIQALYVEYQNS